MFTGDLDNVTAVQILSTGKTTFVGELANIDATSDFSYIAGDVEFQGSVGIIGTKGLTLLGNVTLKNTEFGTAALAAPGTPKSITLKPSTPLTLAAGKTISVGGGKYSGKGVVVPYAPVLTAGPEGVIITAGTGTNAVFTIPEPTTTANSTSEDAAKRNLGKSLTLGTGGIEITSGTLQVAPEATFIISGVTVTTKRGKPNDVKIGFLSVADGGKITLANGTTTGNTSQINIGDTAIKWGTLAGNASLAAAGGTISLGNNTIEGVNGATLAVATNSAVIAVTRDTASLTLKGATLDLAGKGSLTIGGSSIPSGVSKLILTGGAKINLNNPAEGTTAVAPASGVVYTKIGTGNIANNYGAISGDAVLQILSNNTSATPRVLSLAHNGSGSSVNITSDGNGTVTLAKGVVFQ
jgi:hypothetical protein